ncbi:beta strand repeat-containing protein [Schlesneria sp.]|uniref:beta strand repeat-containing protein n=1 Tax=Schlesneria sp. TaxID=2762018 RepID=UPI002F1A7432
MPVLNRFWSGSLWNQCTAGIWLGALLSLACDGVAHRAASAEDWVTTIRAQSDSPDFPEPISEETDIFKERALARARQERLQSQQRKKKRPPRTFKTFFSMTTYEPVEVEDGIGAIGRMSHLMGKTFGRNDTITPFEVMPYILADEHFLFADVRGFVSNRSRLGGNFGLGYRYLSEDYNAWGGASIWYDADDTSKRLFHQVGLSFEGLIDRYELRSNVYIPVTSEQTYSSSIGAERIVGHQLLYGQAVDQGSALTGVDFEVGYSHPIRDRHWLRGFIGGYHFEGGTRGNVDGFRMRAEAVYNNGVTGQLLYTNDPLYGNNLMAGVSLQLPFGSNNPASGWKRNTPNPFRFVERNYNVIISHDKSYENDKVAINPATGLPYHIEQVYQEGQPYSSGNPYFTGGGDPYFEPSGDGTTTNPHNSLKNALATGADVIFVRSGSIINESVTLSEGQQLLGENSQAMPALAIAGGGFVKLPSLSQSAQLGNATVTPRFEGTNGPAVTLASNTQVSGFNFNHIGGNAIQGTNAADVTLRDLTFTQVDGDAINLNNSSGDVTMANIQINSASGNGVVIDGGNADISYDGTGNTITADGDGISVSNTQGGSLLINNATIKATGGAGLKMSNVATDATIASLNVAHSFGPAVAISGTTGTVSTNNGVTTTDYNTYNFLGYTTITSPNGAGFTVNGSDAIINVDHLNVTTTSASPAVSLVNTSSDVTFGNMNLTTQNATGLYARGVSKLQVNDGTLKTVNAPAIDIQGSTINATFSNVSVDGGPFGISLLQSLGNLTLKGNGTLGSGGVIQNTEKGVIINSFGVAKLNWLDLTNNGVGIHSTKSSQLVLSNARITGSTGYGIDSLNDSTLVVQNSLLTGNGAVGGGTIRVQADTTGTFNSQISGNTINDANGTAILYQTLPSGTGASLAASILSNTITASQGSSPVINVNWSGPESVRVSNNTIFAQGTGMTGVLLQGTSTTASMTAQVDGNTITFAGAQGTGVSVIAAATSSLNIATNTVTFGGTGGTGLRFSLSGTSTDYIASNIITDKAGGATGMLFDKVAANSRMQIDGNTINLLANDLTPHYGIMFTNITPTVQFMGTVNNLIYNASTPQTLFSAPVNSYTGGFYINGYLQ